jgi:two-component system, NarL family, sensor kinase
MIFLQVTTNTSSINYVMLFGTLAMLSLTLGIVFFVIFHQRKVIRFNDQLKKLEDDKQQILLNASIKFQEEERNRIAADLHDDVGPLLATARLYLNENLVNQEPAAQLQSIFSAKQIIDDAIQLIRNISHSMMPPTLKNFGLESAMSDLFQKINGSGTLNASVRFHDYRTRLKLEQELLIFRVIQELVNNIIKHSNAGFIHLTQNANATHSYFRLHHDGQGIVQTEFDRLNHVSTGLGLKNIASRIKVLNGRIFFEIDPSHTYFKVTLEIPKDSTY